MAITLEEAKKYLRVDSQDENVFIAGLIEIGEQMCRDIARMNEEELSQDIAVIRIAMLYTVAYLYEHREQADYSDLIQTLRSLLFGIRREVF